MDSVLVTFSFLSLKSTQQQQCKEVDFSLVWVYSHGEEGKGQEHEAADHIGSNVKDQREMGADVQSTFFF